MRSGRCPVRRFRHAPRIFMGPPLATRGDAWLGRRTIPGGRRGCDAVDRSCRRLRHPLMRITAGSPVSRGADPSDRLVERLVEPLRRVTSHAEAAGVRLALENHGDLSSVEILALLSLVSSDALGVCLDNINLIRVGDDMATGSRLLAPHAFLVQLKDCLDGDPRVPGGPISTALGEGSVNLVRVLEILRGAAFAGPVCIEFGSLGPDLVNEFAMLGRSVAWLEAQTVFFSTTLSA